MTVALIDGDEAIFKAAVIQVEDYFDPGEKTAPTLDDAKRTFRRLVEGWAERAGGDELLVCLSPDDRRLFRREIYPGYKSGRGEKPEHFWDLLEWVKAEYPTRQYPGLEADDVMGILSDDDAVIVSSDKDMKTVPGRIYNPKSDVLGVITPARADWQWMLQTLAGDATDGFPGCIGCGPRRAEDLLSQATSINGWWPLVEAEFQAPKKGRYRDIAQNAADAVTQAALARILRPGDYDPERGRIAYCIGPRLFDILA